MADCPGGSSATASSAAADGALIDVLIKDSMQQSSCSEQPIVITPEMKARWMQHTGACSALAASMSSEQAEVCRPQERAITISMVLQALQRIELPKPALSIQPPGGKTLVNFETIFSTDAESFRRTVRLLGHRVQLDITPTSYQWSYGDGTTETTAESGVAWEKGRPMSDYLTHTYEDADVTMKPNVAVTYSARFRVDGGPWRDVSGTVTSEGPAVDLRVIEAETVLLSDY